MSKANRFTYTSSQLKEFAQVVLDAAKRAGVSVRLWAEVERGERENVSVDTLLLGNTRS